MSTNAAPRAVHHLNCGTMCPRGARMITGEGGLLGQARLVCHCLLIEGAEGLVLVDTGFGLDDARNPRQLGRAFTAIVRPRLHAGETAISQVRELGFDPNDVRHIITTHLDLDHAGGLPDFPDAEVHLLGRELDAALRPSWRDRPRYVSAHWAHGPRWVTHDPVGPRRPGRAGNPVGAGGEEWFGFESLRILPDSDDEILLIPLIGHTHGHTGVAIKRPDGWLLHCGDAYFHHGEVSTPPHCPPAIGAFAAFDQADRAARLSNRERLRELAARERKHEGVELICSHDASYLAGP
jgi:glyoxylase-like metal-dependent hydrolase (beta-lactamase superfamily II)